MERVLKVPVTKVVRNWQLKHLASTLDICKDHKLEGGDFRDYAQFRYFLIVGNLIGQGDKGVYFGR